MISKLPKMIFKKLYPLISHLFTHFNLLLKKHIIIFSYLSNSSYNLLQLNHQTISFFDSLLHTHFTLIQYGNL